MIILNRPNALGKVADLNARNEQARRLLGSGHTGIRIVETVHFTVAPGRMTPERHALIKELIAAGEAVIQHNRLAA